MGIIRICKYNCTDGEQLCTLLQHLFGFVDLGGQIWTAASVWMVQDDELPVLLAYHLAGQASVSVRQLVCARRLMRPAVAYAVPSINAASRLFIFDSKPPW